MKVLLCGGAGYIGTHVALEFLKRGDTVGILDDFSSGLRKNIQEGSLLFEGSILDKAHLNHTLRAVEWDCVIHLAAFKAAGESMLDPAKYAHNNIGGSLQLIAACVEHDIKNFILSSSAAVYGEPEYLPIDEEHPTNPTNYYGYTKLVIEENLAWFATLKGLNYVSLRYFNAAGYDLEGQMKGLESNPANLIPVVMETACGLRPLVEIFGEDYPTSDGTGVRDYVHTSDLAVAHALAADYLETHQEPLIVNLGSENGLSVRQIIDEARRVTQRTIPEKIVGRRAGDPAQLVASSALAEEKLGWKARYSSVKTIIETTWRVYQANEV
ncbi:MAG: UDP-glucose 4-epimerase GalE [Sphaerochaetaceae bacterium]